MAELPDEVTRLATTMAERMATPMAEKMAKKVVESNLMRMVYGIQNQVTTMKHQVGGISMELEDIGFELDVVKSIVIALAAQSNLIARKLGVESQISLPEDSNGDGMCEEPGHEH